jgi:hypothetical protein
MARCTLYNITWKDCRLHLAGWWFSLGALLSSTNKTDCHDIAEIMLKVVLNTITLPYPGLHSSGTMPYILNDNYDKYDLCPF